MARKEVIGGSRVLVVLMFVVLVMLSRVCVALIGLIHPPYPLRRVKHLIASAENRFSAEGNGNWIST